MRRWRLSTSGFILYQSLMYFLFCIQFMACISVIAIHIRSENYMMLRMEEFSFFESAVIDRIFHDLEKMDYGDFDLSFKDFFVSVTYQDQSAVLTFTGPTEVKMKLTFDDLLPCFIDYAEAAD